MYTAGIIENPVSSLSLRPSGTVLRTRTKRTGILVFSCGVVAVVVAMLLDVRFNPVFQMPGRESVPDPTMEQRFEACLETRDAAIHRRAFDTIDNPDVQREYITSQRAQARADCRRAHPQHLVLRDRPLRIQLFDARWRD